jgi:hypothetical protein
MCNKLISRSHAIIALWWEKLKEFYPRHEKYGPLSAFILGFIYDTLTLTRIDRWLDNLVLLGYVAMAGVLIALIGMVEHGRIRGGWVVRHPDLITSAAHFFLGGLLSSYVVFYFKSAAVGKTFLFVALLIGLMVANEFLAHRLRNLKLLFALYYFCCFAFLTFFLPVVTHVMRSAMFIAGGLLSLIPPGIVSALICRGRSRLVSLEWLGTMGMPVVIFFAVVFFYFQNWIPPVPLALKEGGIYRSVKRLGDQYEAQYREPSWYQFWRSDDREFIYAQGDVVYCYAAVFAPTALKERIIHHWQRRTADGEWVTTDTMNYSIVGGRDGGYRGFTFKKGITLGRWRVEVKTAEGRLLGRVPFEVISSESAPARIKTTYR